MLGIKMPWTRRREARSAAEAAEQAERDRRLEQRRVIAREELAHLQLERGQRRPRAAQD